MHMVIMGCGRSGAATALALAAQGHDVTVIDAQKSAFRRLPPTFNGRQVTGLGFDKAVLEAAGIADTYGFAALTDGDNSNILAARVVLENFQVEKVVARIADPGRAKIYRRLGIPTVAPVPWITNEAVSYLLPGPVIAPYQDAATGVEMHRFRLHPSWIGAKYTEVFDQQPARLSYLNRAGDPIFPDAETKVQADDECFVMVLANKLSRITTHLLEPRK